MLLVLRGITGVGEAALFVGAITLIADLFPPDRRAKGASYFSIAVFGGLGIGPVLGEWVLDDVNYERAFLTAGALAWQRPCWHRSCRGRLIVCTTRRHDETAGRGILHPAAIGPGLVLASSSPRSRRSPGSSRTRRTVGLSGAGGLFLVSARSASSAGGRRKGA